MHTTYLGASSYPIYLSSFCFFTHDLSHFIMSMQSHRKGENAVSFSLNLYILLQAIVVVLSGKSLEMLWKRHKFLLTLQTLLLIRCYVWRRDRETVSVQFSLLHTQNQSHLIVIFLLPPPSRSCVWCIFSLESLSQVYHRRQTQERQGICRHLFFVWKLHTLSLLSLPPETRNVCIKIASLNFCFIVIYFSSEFSRISRSCDLQHLLFSLLPTSSLVHIVFSKFSLHRERLMIKKLRESRW